MKFIVFKLLQSAFVSQKIPLSKNIPQLFIITPRQRKITNFTEAEVFENWTFLFEGGGNYERAEKVTKIKLVREFVFDKYYHLCTLHLVGYRFAVS